ncbi:MAG: F0F1 ATP synthase subunit delta [Candidatus Omnitrophica bacterium]|nr:F0F1 ATP synthase subunit delta [Candidatus Omnitrophota bacterium]
MILLKIVFLQIILAAGVLFVLWEILKRELVQEGLRAIEQSEVRFDIADVSVITAWQLSSVEENRMRAAVQRQFPSAEVVFVVNVDIMGGLVVKAGDLILDHSLLTRMKHLFGQHVT